MFTRFLTTALCLLFASTVSAKTYYYETTCTKTISIAGPTIAKTLHRIVKENGIRTTEATWAKNWFRLKGLELDRELGNKEFQLSAEFNTYRTPAKVQTSDITALANMLINDVKATVHTYQPINRGPTYEGLFLKDLACGITENILGYEGESNCQLTLEVDCGLKAYTELNK